MYKTEEKKYNRVLGRLIFIVIFSILFFVPSKSEAVLIYATSTRTTLNNNEGLLVTVLIDTQGENLNAVSGELQFDKSLFKTHSLSPKHSIIDVWIDKPYEDNGSIKWAGIIPGGFKGVLSPSFDSAKPGVIFQAIFEGVNPGATSITFNNLTAYSNDGEATMLDVDHKSLSLLIQSESKSVQFDPQNLQYTNVYDNGNKYEIVNNKSEYSYTEYALWCIILVLISLIFYNKHKWPKKKN